MRKKIEEKVLDAFETAVNRASVTPPASVPVEADGHAAEEK
jgi:hypothetical protein